MEGIKHGYGSAFRRRLDTIAEVQKTKHPLELDIVYMHKCQGGLGRRLMLSSQQWTDRLSNRRHPRYSTSCLLSGDHNIRYRVALVSGQCSVPKLFPSQGRIIRVATSTIRIRCPAYYMKREDTARQREETQIRHLACCVTWISSSGRSSFSCSYRYNTRIQGRSITDSKQFTLFQVCRTVLAAPSAFTKVRKHVLLHPRCITHARDRGCQMSL